MDESVLRAAMKKTLLYLSIHKPHIIWDMCRKHQAERCQYLELHKDDYYLGNNERADLIMCCDFLTDYFMHANNKSEICNKLCDILLSSENSHLDAYDKIINDITNMIGSEINRPQIYKDYHKLVSEDDLLQSLFVLLSYENDSTEPLTLVNNNFTVFHGIDNLEKIVEKRFNMGETFSECRFVKKGIRKLKQLIADEINFIKSNGEKCEPELLGSAIADIIIHTNNSANYIPALNTASCKTLKSDYFMPFILYGYEKLVLDTPDEPFDYKTYEKNVKIIDKSIERTCKAAILNKALYDFTDERNIQKPVSVLAAFPSVNEPEEISPNRILKLVKEIDISALFISCVWNAAFALMKEKMIKNSIDAHYYETHHDESRIKEAQNNESAAVGKLKVANKEIESLKERNAALQQTIDRAKNDFLAQFKKEQQSDRNKIAEMDRIIRKQQREIERLKQQLENEKNKNDNIENIPVMKEEAELKKCDFSKRYMFLCGHKILAGRIADAFPNSINSECYNINVKNARTIDAVIAITSEISHNEYDRIKKQCIMHDIPFIHCSSVNIDKIAEKIAEVLQ